MSIRNKLLWAAVVMVFIVCLVGWLFLWTHDIEHRYRSSMVEATRTVTELRELSADVERQIARVDFFLVTGDVQEREVFESLSRLNNKRLKETQGIPWESLYTDVVAQARLLFRGAKTGMGAPLSLRRDYMARSGGLRRQLREYLEGRIAHVEEQRVKTEDTLEKLEWASILIVVFGVILAVVMNIYIYRSIIYPLHTLKEGVLALGRGESGVHVILRGHDEFAILARSFNEMVIKLKELDQMKQDFTASITHELRSPLSAGQSFLNTMLADLDILRVSSNGVTAEDLDRWRKFLERLKANMDLLSRFVTDMLEVAKIERGKLECHLGQADVRPMLRETADFFQEKARQKQIVLRSAIPENLPICLADLDRIRQVVVNLVDNALKFTPRGGVVELEARAGGPGFVRILIRDSGPGIPKEYRYRLFHKFEQIRESYRYAEGAKGTGLGLAICKAIVDLHGGTIGVESPGANQGSIFYFTIPVIVKGALAHA
ncbi:MAG: HAMP domain-containing histidine kinase [Elusimicrobia bacterium]|nr:HAMP domain-containing histidine kinase [Elusimicrobiota bacterium]